MQKTFLFTVLTKSGIKFYIEASNRHEAEQRARHPAIARELSLMINQAIAEVDSVDVHRGPSRLLSEKLVFRDDIFI